MTGTLEIKGLPLETLDALNELALQKGQTAADFVREIIEIEVLSSKSFDEVLAPIRQGFEESGLNEEELDELFEAAREEVYQEKQLKKP